MRTKRRTRSRSRGERMGERLGQNRCQESCNVPRGTPHPMCMHEIMMRMFLWEYDLQLML
jgi:hypothetical protein